MDNKETQANELLALASIYEDTIFGSSQDEDDIPGGEFKACLELPEDFQVTITESTNDRENQAPREVQHVHTVLYLPPVVLHFQLPLGYPSKEPPKFTLSCKWLSLQQLSTLCLKLDQIWKENEGQEILFLWTNFLKDESFDSLQLSSPLDLSLVCAKKVHRQHSQNQHKHHSDTDVNAGASNVAHTSTPLTHDQRAIQDIGSQDLLLPTILEYDKQRRVEKFSKTLFTCSICFVEKLGCQCMSYFGCDHVFCKDCMRGYFEVKISDGSVNALTCPYHKCQSQAHPSQVKELVSLELFNRYDRLLLQCSLDLMSDIVYCPRQGCDCPVILEPNSTMGRCPACHYVFCILCKLTYHGLSPCKLSPEKFEKLKEEYLNSSAEEKKLLESKYGKRMLQMAVEETFSRNWLEKESKKCPHCKSHIQKIDGCNKMNCYHCHEDFCWLCLAVLPQPIPYRHFNDPKSKCYNALFQGVIMGGLFDDEEDDDEDFVF